MKKILISENFGGLGQYLNQITDVSTPFKYGIAAYKSSDTGLLKGFSYYPYKGFLAPSMEGTNASGGLKQINTVSGSSRNGNYTASYYEYNSSGKSLLNPTSASCFELDLSYDFFVEETWRYDSLPTGSNLWSGILECFLIKGSVSYGALFQTYITISNIIEVVAWSNVYISLGSQPLGYEFTFSVQANHSLNRMELYVNGIYGGSYPFSYMPFPISGVNSFSLSPEIPVNYPYDLGGGTLVNFQIGYNNYHYPNTAAYSLDFSQEPMMKLNNHLFPIKSRMK